MILVMAKKYSFTKNQIKRMANILDNAGQVFLGVATLPPLFTKQFNSSTFATGLVLVIFLWWISLRLERMS